MTKLISKETRDEVVRLRFEENLPFSEIAKRANVGRSKAAEICREEEVKRKRGAEEKIREHEKSRTAQELGADLELQAQAFLMFEQGKGPTDLVKEKLCTANVAQALWEKYRELKGESKLRIEKLKETIDMLEDRVSGLEEFCATPLTNHYECPHCKVVGKVAVRFQCTACGHEDWMGYQVKKKPESIYK